MKTIHCDICGKDFGHSVSFTIQPMYVPSDFSIDGGFYATSRTSSDVCNDCYNKIAEAQSKAIEGIKSPKQ